MPGYADLPNWKSFPPLDVWIPLFKCVHLWWQPRSACPGLREVKFGVPCYPFKMCLLGFKIHYFPELLANVDLTRWSDFHYHFVSQLWPFQQFWLMEFIVWIRVGWEILDLSCPWQRVSPAWPGGPRKILASGVPVGRCCPARPLIHHWGGDAVSTLSLLSMGGRSSNMLSPLWIIHFRKRNGLIYNYRKSVPVKIDSLGLLVEGKENWTIFSWPHCGIFKTSNEGTS